MVTRLLTLMTLAPYRRRLDVAAEVFDATPSEVVLGIVGPRSRELLQSLTLADLSNDAWPFAASRQTELAAASIRMTRMSFTGELGFELDIPVENAPAVYESIAGAGQAFGLAHCGHFALDSCRHEKGYRHWGHDIGPHDTPLEAGLGFAVAWDKSGGRGFRTGVSLCFAYRQCEPGTPRSELLDGGYEIGIAGERFPLRALARPVYDPGGARLRS